MISVRIGPPDPTLSDAFEALAQRAAPNVFMHPAALGAARASGFAHVHVLEAWLVHGPEKWEPVFGKDHAQSNDNRDGATRTLVGLWALGEQRVARIGPPILVSPPYDYAFVGGAVVDPDHADAVMAAFFDAIANARQLPKVVKLKLLDGDAATFRPMMTALAARRGEVLRLREQPRPFLSGASDRKRSGSTAKKLRQDWNRLAAQGAVDIANPRRADEVRAAFDTFLEMEASSWKGQNGTALLSDNDDADFARALIADLSARRSASVALLRVDQRPIAAQVLLYCGSMAYTWKTAFDAAFAKFSPGVLLVDKITDALFAAGVTQIESCATEDSFMAQLWTGRRATVDLLVDVGAEPSLSFVLAHLGERGYAVAREGRQWMRGRAWLPMRAKNLAVTRG